MKSMKKILFSLSLSFLVGASGYIIAKCTCKDYEHTDTSIRHCPYTQQDIQRMQQENPGRYTHHCHQACMYCGCSMCEHTNNNKDRA